MNKQTVWLFSIIWCFTAEMALAEPIVELDLIIRGRVTPTAPQEWGQVLGAAGFSRPTIRGARVGDEFGIETLEGRRQVVYRVTGYLLDDGAIVLPPRTKFSLRDAGRLSAWVEEMKKNGPESATAGTSAFGLTPQRLIQVNKDLQQTVGFSTQGADAAQLVNVLGQDLTYPLRLDSTATRALEIDSKVRDELKGLSTGTALAAVLRPAGLVLRPRYEGGKLEYLIADPRQRGDNWPIGWASKESPGKLIPQLFDRDETATVEVPLSAALTEISGRIKIPILLDHNGMALNRVDPHAVMVTIEAGKLHYGGILNDLLRQARLRYEVRVDENKKPFLWVTTLK